MQPQNRKWYADSLWYLLNLTPNELREIFPDHKWNSLKGKRKLYKRKIKTGEETMPPKPDDYEFGDTTEQIRNYLNGTNHTTEEKENIIIDGRSRAYLHKLLDKTLDETNINPSHVSKFSVRAGSHEGYIKNSDGEIEYTKDLKNGGISLVIEPEKFEPQWETVKRFESEPIPFSKKLEKLGSMRREVIMPDLQIGYRRYEDGSLDPFHDTKAIDIALQIIRDVKPTKVIFLGDFLDLPNFGKYLQSPEFAHTTNESIKYGHNLLRTVREIVPKAEIIFLEGNHSRRLEKNIKTNLMEAYGLKRATESMPVLSIPYLLALDTLGVEYVGGYPAGRYFITPTLQCIHGEILGKHTMAKSVTDYEGVSTIHGHAHRWQSYAKTTRIYNGARQTFSFSLGTLSRIDGTVPSMHGSTNVDGTPVTSHEDWQQLIGIVTHNGDSWSLQPVFIDTLKDYITFFEGKVYKPLGG